MMHSEESSKYVSIFTKSLFKSLFLAAPKAIVYDNSCNLHQYSLNRDPGFFTSTSFLVDRFHWKNHTGTVSVTQEKAILSFMKES